MAETFICLIYMFLLSAYCMSDNVLEIWDTVLHKTKTPQKFVFPQEWGEMGET
jgi:hypothetical protein